MSSTEIHENAYGVMQQCYTAGTRNITSQLVKNYMLRDRYMHRCLDKVPIEIAPVGSQNRRQEDNSIVTAHQEQSVEPVFLRVHACNEASITVTKIVTEPYDTLVTLPWAKVGVKRYVSESTDKFELALTDVRGKGVLVQHVLSEYKTIWLQSKRTY